MKAGAQPLISIFQQKIRLEVPLFQRQYVWNRDDHWTPLWDDIATKFADYIEGRENIPLHFLGAMVLEQRQTPTTHVEKRLVIDGQQRLTTFQIFLAAFRDYCRAQGHVDISDELRCFTFNQGLLQDKVRDKFKVWPTQADRPQFQDVIETESKDELESKYPLVRRKYFRLPDPRPPMVEGYLYFYEQLQEFFNGKASELGSPEASLLEQALFALQNALQVVVIDLEPGDDAQMIFETLNARGEALLPADLLKNYIFRRVSLEGLDIDLLYQRHWERFDGDFWRANVGQGRNARPRSDLFLQHYLTCQLNTEVPIRSLYSQYKHWTERSRPFNRLEDELLSLAHFGDLFQTIVDPTQGSGLLEFSEFLQVFELSTVYPLLMTLLDLNLEAQDFKRALQMLESYVLRRAVCNRSSRSYGRIFINLMKAVKENSWNLSTFGEKLVSLKGNHGWPSDAEFEREWCQNELLGILSTPRVNYILRKINEFQFGATVKEVTLPRSLTVEHILPREWRAHWPAEDEELRNTHVNRIGNLTLVTGTLNGGLSNKGWRDKQADLQEHSFLPLNRKLVTLADWNEQEIDQRSAELFETARVLWPHPDITVTSAKA